MRGVMAGAYRGATTATRIARRTFFGTLRALVLIIPIGLVLFDWWSSSVTGTATVEDGRAAAPELANAQQVVGVQDGSVVSSGPAPGTVVLTFDDGPDARWTPQVLDVLAKHDVKATFFVVGQRVVDAPDLAKRIVDEGHEIANHTFTHPNLADEPAWRQRLELSLTDRVVAGATGRRPTVFRFPYSSSADSATPAELETIRRVGSERTAAFSDAFVRDYAVEDSGEIIERAWATDPTVGLVLLLHDGGGDRSATVASLDEVISILRGKGMQFQSLSESLGLPPGSANPPADRLDRWTGMAAIEALQIAGLLRQVIRVGAWALLGWALVKVVLDVVFLLLHRRRMARRVVNLDFEPSVSVIVPAYNEAATIVDALSSIAASTYPLTEIVVVDDGSTDDTAAIAESLGISIVRVLRQQNAGKAAALNHGVRLARGDIVVCVDADTVFQSDTLNWIVQPFAGANVAAVSGNVKVGNRRSLLGRWQHVEYTYGQRTERCAQELLGVTWCIPGAIGAFRRNALLASGGFSTDTMAEDTDTAVKVYLDGWDAVFEPRSIAWTEVPTRPGALWRQRMRWHFGNYQVLWKQKAHLYRRPRRFGFLMLPYAFVSLVVMPLALPIIDVLALVQIVTRGPGTAVYLWLVLAVLTAAAAGLAMHVSGEKIRSIVHLPVQQFVYRWMYIALSLKALRMALSGALVAWNKPKRLGEAGHALIRDLGESEVVPSGAARREAIEPGSVLTSVNGVES